MRDKRTVEHPQPTEPLEPKTIVRALRRHTGQTQQAAADKSGVLSRDEFSRIEIGRIKASSARAQAGLGRAFDLRVETIADLLEGKITLEEAIARIGERDSPAGSARLSDRPEWKESNLVAEAQALYRQMHGPSSPEVWTRLASVLDSGAFPRPLTPGFLAQVAHALAIALPEAAPEPAPGAARTDAPKGRPFHLRTRRFGRRWRSRVP
jgi:transcriptional regulator with XRE-family HTH domain